MADFQDAEIFRTVLDNLQTGIFLADRERKIRFWNGRAEQITGYHGHEIIGHSCRDTILVNCDGRRCGCCGATCLFSAAMHEGKARHYRAYFQHKAGHRVGVGVWTTPLRDQHSSVIGTAGAFEELHPASASNRRQDILAINGCLDRATGIPNRGFTEFHVRQNLATLNEHGLPFGVVWVRVEELQKVMARFGREAEDAVLDAVVETIRNGIRPTDFLGRWADDLFLVIAIHCTVDGLETVSERLQKAVGQAELHWWGEDLAITTSQGHASAKASDSVESLLGRATLILEHDRQKSKAASGVAT